MVNPKNILVITTPSTEGLKIKKHLKPVSAHIVAGTNLFDDFLAGLTDAFGGRSNTYQKQLSSLYNDAIEVIKLRAHEIGANCVIGLSIDMDEISGKGKSMFMLTAIGTAVIIEKEQKTSNLFDTNEKFENVGVERINSLRQRKNIIEKAKNGQLIYNSETWDYITSNKIEEIFPYILKRFTRIIEDSKIMEHDFNIFNKNFMLYIDSLEDKKIELLYDNIESETNPIIASYLSEVIKELNLFNYEKSMILLENSDFKKQKIGLKTITFDKPFYNKKDVNDLEQIKTYVSSAFNERGEKTTKKQLLSSKEKDVWNCECGNKSIEIGEHCGICYMDIYGFEKNEIKPQNVIEHIEQKIELINEYLK